MAYTDIFRVWKNKEHRRGLSKEQPAVLPEHPAGLMELADAELDYAAGGGGPPEHLGDGGNVLLP